MRRMYSILTLTLSGVLFGCQPQPTEVATAPEPERLVQACEAPPPKIIEVPIPVPMPCQLQPDPVFETKAPRRKGKASVQPVAQTGINSVQTYHYMPDALFQVYVAVNNATTILLQPGEYFHQAVIGDKGKWSTSEVTAGSQTGERGGVVVNCNEAGARSNLTIAASKRVYLLDLHCTASTYHAQVSWTYPEDRGVGMLTGHKPAASVHPALAPVMADAPSGAQYTIKSNREVAWMPTQVYDTGVQGKQTYIVFPPALGTTDAPVLYVRTAENTQAVTNYRTKSGWWINDRIHNAETFPGTLHLGEPVTYYVADMIADAWELRVGERKPTVVKIMREKTEGR